MRILVTGGGGFLGTWIVRELLKNPRYLVTNFSRHSYAHLEDIGVPTIRGDLRKVADLERALTQGFDAVIHTASLVGMWGRAQDFDEINVEGTRALLAVAREHGVRRFVYTSSPSVVFGRGGHRGADETLAHPTEHLGHYPRTKAQAEALVLAADAEEFHTTALRPHLIWGPGDQNLLPRVIAKARAGKLRRVGDGSNEVDVIYVEEAARAHVLALEALGPQSKAKGQAFFLGQGPVKLWDFIESVLAQVDAPAPEASVSVAMAYRLGAVCEALWKLLGIMSPEPPLTRFVALNLGRDHYFSHAKAQEILGWVAQISLEEGLQRTFSQRASYRHLLSKEALAQDAGPGKS